MEIHYHSGQGGLLTKERKTRMINVPQYKCALFMVVEGDRFKEIDWIEDRKGL